MSSWFLWVQVHKITPATFNIIYYYSAFDEVLGQSALMMSVFVMVYRHIFNRNNLFIWRQFLFYIESVSQCLNLLPICSLACMACARKGQGKENMHWWPVISPTCVGNIPSANILSRFADFQLVFSFEQTRTVTIFGEHGIMTRIPWWLSQSEL